MSRLRTFCIAAFAAASASIAPLAHAALGDTAASIGHDRQVMNAEPSTTSMPSYDRHELKTADGAVVREYATRDAAGGKVFAIGFDGPTMPDMKTVLGAHYDRYMAAAAARRGHNHHVMTFDADGLVVTIVRMPRGFQGEARLPALVPQGVAVEDLR